MLQTKNFNHKRDKEIINVDAESERVRLCF